MSTVKKSTHTKSVDEYIAGFPKDVQEKLERIRETIRKTVPEAEEKISYGIPAFNYLGRYLIYFAGYKNHIGVNPVPTGNKDFDREFSPYKTSGKGAIQFSHSKPIPFDLVIKIVKFRVRENEKKNKGKVR